MLEAILVTALGALLVLAIGSLAYRRVRQRQVAQGLRIDTENGIVEERFIALGGIEQWVLIRGEDRANPVLLVLHGGPGWPNAVFAPLLRSWERHFTVVQWDMRGTAKTLGRNGKTRSGPMTFEARVTDAIELVEFLCRHLDQGKVILLAESMGTLVGAPLVKRRPDLFSAYVATDLYVNMVGNEALKRQMTLDRLRAAGNLRGVRALEATNPDPARWSRRDWSVNMGLAFETNLPLPRPERSLLFPLILSSPLYSLRDLYHLVIGFQFCTTRMFDQIMAFDVRKLGTRFEVPFFVFQGASDVVTLTPLAREYFDEVDAPIKGLALIEDAGHFAAFTQPERFLAELLAQVRSLALPATGALGRGP